MPICQHILQYLGSSESDELSDEAYFSLVHWYNQHC
jgi:hypothetical protein